MKEFSVGYHYVQPEYFSYLMSHLGCMATTFPTDECYRPHHDMGNYYTLSVKIAIKLMEWLTFITEKEWSQMAPPWSRFG